MSYTRGLCKYRRLGFLVSLFCSLTLFPGCQSAGSVPEINNSEKLRDVSPAVIGRRYVQFVAAQEALEAGRNDIARTLLLKLTSDAPDLSSPWVNLGIAYRNLGEDENAIRAFERALIGRPGSCEALNQLGILARETGNFEAAEARYITCLKSTPDFREVHLNLGILYELYMGKYAAALSEYRSYMAGLDEPDRRVGGWIMDLERRQSSMLATENY